jgi:hypothetical protein
LSEYDDNEWNESDGDENTRRRIRQFTDRRRKGFLKMQGLSLRRSNLHRRPPPNEEFEAGFMADMGEVMAQFAASQCTGEQSHSPQQAVLRDLIQCRETIPPSDVEM